MREFFRYFFGAATEAEGAEFHHFTLAHLLPILLAAGVIFLIWYFRDKLKENPKLDMRLRWVLAFTMIVCEMSYYWRLTVLPELNGNTLEHLPITVCGWATIFGSYMIITKSQALFDITYFWIFSGSIFALITPTVITYTGPARFRFYQFWGEHLLAYVAVFLLIFVHGMRPNRRSIVRAGVLLGVLGFLAMGVNKLLGPGANYLFMAEPESTPSILDILPPVFIVRVIVMIAAVSLLFFLSYLPWLLLDRRAAKAAAEGAAEETAE
ncbi:MAG: TIGR02206 family membrane protein [Clostridia bacterium]|nr:TIGR02206 family membrane protein [Clostridia bacterium]